MMKRRWIIRWLVAVAGLMPGISQAGLTEPTRIDLQQETPAFATYLVRGWHVPDSGAAWTGRDGEDATIRIPVEPGYGYDVLLFPQVVPQERFDRYSVELLVNGRVVRTLTGGEAAALVEVTTPEWALEAETVEVSIRTPLFCPLELGESTDARQLGIKFSRVEIVPWRRERVAMEGDERAVGIFRDPDVPHDGAPSDPDFLAQLLREAGIPVRMLSAAELASPAILDRERLDLVVLPYGPAFPDAARNAFRRFLRRGGSFISMGGYALDSLYGAGFGEELLANPTFDEGLDGWSAVSDVAGVEMDFDGNIGRTRPGSARVHVEAHAPVTWYALTAELAEAPVGATIALDGYVRTENHRDGAGAYAAVSFHSAEGERISWADTNFATGTSEWTRCRARSIVPDGTVRAIVSLLMHGRGTAWFDDLHVRAVPTSLNTRGGRPADFLEVEPDQISVFDAGYPLEHAVALEAAEGQTFFDGVQIRGPLTGMAAVGMTGTQWYCTAPDKCRYVPLLQTRDGFGRPRGPAGGLMLNYRGLYKGSGWAFFGVDNTDLFSQEHEEMCRGFVRLVQRLRSPMFLHETGSDLACYRPGEEVTLSAAVSAFGEGERSATVRLSVREAQTAREVHVTEHEVTLSAGITETLQAIWAPGEFEQDVYRIEAVLLQNGGELDREDTNGFVVWNDEVLRQAPRLTLRDNFFEIGDRPIFMTGGQQFWASASVLNSSPLTIERDFRDMRDYGVRLARSFMMWQLRGDHEERRFRDMMVYLAHKHGVVMYHEGTGQFPPRSDDLAEERRRARFLAERYGHLPLFCVDHRNEPSLRLEDSPRQNAWLEAFAAAKYPDGPPYEPVVGRLSARWGDLRSYDTALAAADRMARWAREMSEEMHRIVPDLAVSVGFLQEGNRATVIKDPLWASEGLDFMNRHFYGPLERFPPQFKEIDMRYRGAPPSTGEFGSRTHPTGGGNYESKEDQFTRYQFISHYALGLGGAFVSNWHWRDPWESIFSYGVMRQDNVPKDIAKVYRQIGLLMASFEPVYQPPQVYVLLPDYHRMSHYPLSESLYRALDEMMNLRVNFGVIPERELDRLPEGCRAILFPLPYLPAQKTVERLEAFVEAGGLLYMSGDLCHSAEDLQRSHPERLARLCGVDSEAPQKVGLSDLGVPQDEVMPTGVLPGLGRYSGRNRLALTPRGAQVAAADQDGRPVAVVHSLGQGRVLFTADPLETDARALSDSGMYGAFLAMARLRGWEVSPDEPWLHCFGVPTRQGTAYVLYNRTRAAPHEPFDTGLPKPFGPGDLTRVSVAEADATMELAPMKPGLAHIARDGALLAAQAQGAVRYRGQNVLDTDTHVTVVSLDGADLRASQHLAVIALYPGVIRLARSAEGLAAEVGELSSGRWTTLSEVDLQEGEGGMTIVVDESIALEVVLVGRDLEQTRRRLEALAGF